MLVLLRGPHLIDGSGGFGRNHSLLVVVAPGVTVVGIGAVALDLVEAADRVVAVRDEEHVVRHPAVVEPVGPDAGDAALGHLHHVVLRERPPLGDDDRIDVVVVGPGAGRRIQVGLRLVQIVDDRRVPLERFLRHRLRQLEELPHAVAVVVVLHVLCPAYISGSRASPCARFLLK